MELAQSSSLSYPSVRPGMFIARGVFSIIFGILAMLLPEVTLFAIAILYGVYALVDGVFAVASSMRRGRHHKSWGLLLVEGILGISIGLITMVWPGLTVYGLSLLVGFWAVSTGALEVLAAFNLSSIFRRVTPASRFLLGMVGLVSIALGVAVFVWPVIGAVTLITLVAAYSICFGALCIALGVQLRQQREREPDVIAGPDISAGDDTQDKLNAA